MADAPRQNLAQRIDEAQDALARAYQERLPHELKLRSVARRLQAFTHDGINGLQAEGEALHNVRFPADLVPKALLHPEEFEGFEHLGLFQLEEHLHGYGGIGRALAAPEHQPLLDYARNMVRNAKESAQRVLDARTELEALCKRARRSHDFTALDQGAYHAANERFRNPAPAAAATAEELTQAWRKGASGLERGALAGHGHGAAYYLDQSLADAYHTKLMGRVDLANTLDARMQRLAREGEPKFDFGPSSVRKAPALQRMRRSVSDFFARELASEPRPTKVPVPHAENVLLPMKELLPPAPEPTLAQRFTAWRKEQRALAAAAEPVVEPPSWVSRRLEGLKNWREQRRALAAAAEPVVEPPSWVSRRLEGLNNWRAERRALAEAAPVVEAVEKGPSRLTLAMQRMRAAHARRSEAAAKALIEGGGTPAWLAGFGERFHGMRDTFHANLAGSLGSARQPLENVEDPVFERNMQRPVWRRTWEQAHGAEEVAEGPSPIEKFRARQEHFRQQREAIAELRDAPMPSSDTPFTESKNVQHLSEVPKAPELPEYVKRKPIESVSGSGTARFARRKLSGITMPGTPSTTILSGKGTALAGTVFNGQVNVSVNGAAVPPGATFSLPPAKLPPGQASVPRVKRMVEEAVTEASTSSKGTRYVIGGVIAAAVAGAIGYAVSSRPARREPAQNRPEGRF